MLLYLVSTHYSTESSFVHIVKGTFNADQNFFS